MESLDELVETEKECIRRFRAKAAEIKAQHPGLSSQISFARAIQSLPQTANRYMEARQRLQFAGIVALPLR